MPKKQKRGRPPGPKGAYNPEPPRQLGRVCDEQWEFLKRAAAAEEKPFSTWALEILSREAKKVLFKS